MRVVSPNYENGLESASVADEEQISIDALPILLWGIMS